MLLVCCIALLCSRNTASASTIIHARVAPVREIVINDDNKIIRVDSNTTQDVTPTVRRGTIGGPIVRITTLVQSEYNAIKGKVDFSYAGTVYRRSSEPSTWLVRQWRHFLSIAYHH